MKNLDGLSQTHLAWRLGARTPGQVVRLEPLSYNVAAQHLSWLRKAGGDLDAARKLRNQYSLERKRARAAPDAGLQRYLGNAARTVRVRLKVVRNNRGPSHNRRWYEQDFVEQLTPYEAALTDQSDGLRAPTFAEINMSPGFDPWDEFDEPAQREVA